MKYPKKIVILFIFFCLGIVALVIVSLPQRYSGPGPDHPTLADVRQIQTALDLYFKDNSAYPDKLGMLIPKYLPKIRDPDTFHGRHECKGQNDFAKSYVKNSTGYVFIFCLEGSAGGLEPGIHAASKSGIK